jgi:hypothetical protein
MKTGMSFGEITSILAIFYIVLEQLTNFIIDYFNNKA